MTDISTDCDKLTPGSLVLQSPHFGAVPRFLMCRYRSFPPGVLMTRTKLLDVLYLERKFSDQHFWLYRLHLRFRDFDLGEQVQVELTDFFVAGNFEQSY